jgi:hypothetical protein
MTPADLGNLAGKADNLRAERREGSTRLPIVRVPQEYAGNLSLSLAYSVGLHSHRLERHVNPYPVGTKQAEAWDAGRAAR